MIEQRPFGLVTRHHLPARIKQALRIEGIGALRLIDEQLQARRDAVRDMQLCLIDGAQRLRLTEAGDHVIGLGIHGARNRHHMPLVRYRYTGAAIALGKVEPALLQRRLEAGARVRHRPAFLDGGLHLSGIVTLPLGLLPFL